MAAFVQRVSHQGQDYCLIAQSRPDALVESGTHFFTDKDNPVQGGAIERKQGDTIAAHYHLDRPQVVQPSGKPWEVLVVVDGLVRVRLYDYSGQNFWVGTLLPGDMIILLYGGHSFEFVSDSLLWEVKQGPYPAVGDKILLPQFFASDQETKSV